MVRTGQYLVAIAFGTRSALSLLTPVGLVVELVHTGRYELLHRVDGVGAVVTLTVILGGAAIAWAVWAARSPGRGKAGT
jgi:hypothetical protein